MKKEQKEKVLELVSIHHPDFNQVDAAIFYALEEFVDYEEFHEMSDVIVDLENKFSICTSAFERLLKENLKLIERLNQLEQDNEIQRAINRPKN
tara:strand:+ start:1159 stop:1440 length:282 start_codon:yes stop_codon:yes gene_type:complete